MGKNKNRFRDVLIVGGGPAGIMAAVTAAGRGKSVLLLDRMDRIGKKLLATGNGKCNYTNAHMDAGCFHGDRAFISHILSSFSHADCVGFFRSIGILPKERNGYFYPRCGQALSVLLALERELAARRADVVTGAALIAVKRSAHGFVLETTAGNYSGARIVFATGLMAAPRLGSDGSALPVIEGLGHRIAPVLPALCGLYCRGMDFKKVSGVRCDAMLSLFVDDQPVMQEMGELQLTDYGLSGIPVFQLSGAAVRALHRKRTVRIRISFLPELTREALSKELSAREARALPYETAGQLLCGLVHEKLIPVVLSAAGIGAGHRGGLSRREREGLLQALTDYTVTPVRGREAEFAQVCTGGVSASEVCPATLESRLVSGVHFAGELLDVDGICGGYNLQWAWSTGYVAGKSV